MQTESVKLFTGFFSKFFSHFGQVLSVIRVLLAALETDVNLKAFEAQSIWLSFKHARSYDS